MLKNSKEKGVTLIALIVGIIVLLILAGVSIAMITGENGILTNTKESKEKTNKQTATEIINLKIVDSQIKTYGKEQRMPTLQEIANHLCEDDEIQYVTTSREVSSLDKITVGDAESIFTKLKEYPYRFEINSSLQLASIDDVKIGASDTSTVSREEYNELLNRINELENRIVVLENRTTMKTVDSGMHNTTLQSGPEWKTVETYIANEDCYANIYGCIQISNNDSIEYKGIRLLKNDTFIGASGKGGKGGDTQDDISSMVELKKGDKITLQAIQYTGSTQNVMSFLNVSYFPISK